MRPEMLIGETPPGPGGWRSWLDQAVLGLVLVILLAMLVSVPFGGCAWLKDLPIPDIPAPTPTVTPTPTPTPAPTPCATPPAEGCWQSEDGCTWVEVECPQPECRIDGLPGPPLEPYAAQLGGKVNEAIHALRPDCDVGGTCLLQETQQAWLGKVAAKLRETGLCAGQHVPGHTDEIAVATSPIAPREGYHVFAGDDSPGPLPPGARRTVVWAPYAYRGAYRAPTEPDNPTPTPTPEPEEVYGCPAPLPMRAYETGQPAWEIGCKLHGRKVDCTPIAAKQCDFCAAIGLGEMGGIIRCACPPRPDGHPDRIPCETYLSGGGFVLESRFGAACDGVEGNPMQFYPNGGNCRLCSFGEPKVCGDWF